MATRNQKTLVFYIQLATALAITFIAIAFHVLFIKNAGNLWRDEIHTLRLATLGTLSDLPVSLHLDCFPILHYLVVRAWTSIPCARSIEGIRALGLLIGLAILGALWLNARVFGHKNPLIGVFLLGLSPLFIHAVDTLRPYGLGALFTLLTFGSYWTVSERPRIRPVVLATIFGILMVQCQYPNMVLFGAICTGGVVVCMFRGQWKRSAMIVGMGFVTTLTLIPYFWVWQRFQEVAIILNTSSGIDYVRGITAAIQAFGSPQIDMIFIWIGLWLFSGFVTWGVLGRIRGFTEERRVVNPNAIKYAVSVLVISTLAYLIFLVGFLSGAQLFPRYYVPLIVVQAQCFDVIWGQYKRAIVPRLALLVLLLVIFMPSALRGVVVRQTNVDLIAAKLATLAQKDDLIIVSPWYAGISFHRYYTGTTPWVTVPELQDTTLQRYDMIKQKMVEERPLAHVLEKMHEVLQRGNTVWVAGQLPWVSPKTHLGCLPPAPHPVTGWWVCAYDEHWAREVAQALEREATERSVIMVPAGVPLNRYENFCIEARRARIHR